MRAIIEYKITRTMCDIFFDIGLAYCSPEVACTDRSTNERSQYSRGRQ